jgi:ketosteroid isomerase-like protein
VRIPVLLHVEVFRHPDRGRKEMTEEQNNLRIVRDFFAAVQSGADAGAMASFYCEDVIQEEFPNAFLPKGARRNLAELQEAAARGRKAMSAQTFEILRTMAQGNTVAVEAAWSGTLAVSLGERAPVGTVMKARFAQFFEFRDGRIAACRNYDCFYPWEQVG